MGKVIQLVLGALMSAAMMYVAFRDVNLSELKNTLASVSLWPIIPFIGMWCFHFIVRSIRWRFLLPTPQVRSPTIRELFDSTILGNLASFLLPFRLGEFIRPLILSRWTEYSFASAFASVVIERFFDLAAALVSFAIIIPLLPSLPQEARLGAIALGGLAGALLIFIIAGCFVPSLVRKIIGICVKPLPQKVASFAVKFSNDLLEGAAVVGTISRLSIVIALTILVWGSTFAQFYVLYWMFPHPGSLLLAVTMGVFVAFAVALPSTPGFVGVFQVACVGAANLLGYPNSAAQAYSLIIHVLIYLIFIVVGFSLLAIHDLSLGELKSAVQKKPDNTPVTG